MNGAAAADGRAWLGPAPSAIEMAATLFAGVTGIMFAGVGPLLLGALEHAGRLSAAQIGEAGMVELLSMGIAAGLTGILVGATRLRGLTIAAGLLMALLNLATIWCDGWALVAIRGLIGLPSGALIWLMTAMIVRSARPDRWAAIYLTVQTLAQAVIVAALGALVAGPAGVGAGFAVLAAIGIATGIAGLVVPNSLVVLPVDPDQPTGRLSTRGLVALGAAFAFNAGILAVWIYVEPLSRQSGHPAGTAGLAMALSLGAQVAGGLVATFTAGRIPTAPTLVVSLLGMGAAMVVFAYLPGVTVFLAVSAMFGFLWMFASPFFTPLVIDADPTRRAAMFGSGAALLGCSAGPFLASLFVGDADVRQSLTLGIGLLATSLVIVILLYFVRARSHSFAA